MLFPHLLPLDTLLAIKGSFSEDKPTHGCQGCWGLWESFQTGSSSARLVKLAVFSADDIIYSITHLFEKLALFSSLELDVVPEQGLPSEQGQMGTLHSNCCLPCLPLGQILYQLKASRSVFCCCFGRKIMYHSKVKWFKHSFPL